jgi:hypothetical protein
MSLHLENLQREGYFISTDEAKFRFKDLINYPNALGYDEVSGGYLVLHKGHQPGGIADEMVACLILKKNGYKVTLLDESAATGIEPDAKVNGVYCDIKRLYKATNLLERLSRLFRKVTEMKIQKIVLHIDQNIKRSDLEKLLSITAQRRPKISGMILIFEGIPYHLTRQQLIDKKWS